MSKNIFGGGGDEKVEKEFQDKVDIHSKSILKVLERQKGLDVELENLDEKIELLDHNSIKNFKKIFNEIKLIKISIRDVKEEVTEIKEFNRKVTKQLRLTSTRDETAKLEKYIDLWNPMEFVTRDELKENRQKTITAIEQIVKKFMQEEDKTKNNTKINPKIK